MFGRTITRLGRRWNRAVFEPRRIQAALGDTFTLEELARYPREQSEAIIRSLCFGAYLGDGTMLCRVLGRYKMLVDAEDMGVSVHLLADGYWEMWHTEVMLRLLRPGMVAVDIGANLGYFSLLMSELVGEAGTVHAFEPNSAIAARLRGSLGINGFGERATVHEMALGDRSGRALLSVPPRGPGGGHVLHDDAGQAGESIGIARLDDIPALAAADYIKIDVEGAEHAVWRGMRGLIAQGRPLVVVIEFTAARYTDPAGFLAEIAAGGFTLALIDHKSGVVPIDAATLLARSPVEEHLILVQR